MDIASAVRGAPKRVVTVKGPLQAVIKALNMIASRLVERNRENRRNAGSIPAGRGELFHSESILRGSAHRAATADDEDVKSSLTLLISNAQVVRIAPSRACSPDLPIASRVA